MGKVRVYEIAKEVGVPNKELVEKVRGLGIDVKNHMSSIDMDDVARVKRALEKERLENREVKRISATVIRRRSRASKKETGAAAAPSAEPTAAAEETGAAEGAAGAPETAREPGADKTAAEPARRSAEAESEAAAPQAAGEQRAEAVPSAPAEAGGGQVRAEAQPSAEAEAAPGKQAEQAEQAGEPSAAAGAPSAKSGEGEAAQARAGDGGDGAAAAKKPSGDKTSATPARREAPKREIRFAPGYGPNTQPAAHQRRTRARQVSEAQPVSAAEAVKMMTPTAPRRPKVVITDLDSRRRDMRKDLFADRRFRGGRRKKRQASGKKGKKTEITMPAEHKRVIRMQDSISVAELARQMGVKATSALKKLWAMGMTNIMITHSIDADAASLLAADFGYEVEDVAFKEESVLQEVQDAPEDLEGRSPVVTVMGHVDHGKTSLLDAIRGTDVVAGEAGGITQHMGAYRVRTPKGDVVFLDTPGHEAFTAMRARGAQCTDVVVLVVAADDGVMPQTVEAIDHARDADVPIVVALNKIDKADANPDRVKTALAERNLVPEEWGGDTQVVPVSAISKEGIEDLLESLVLQAELLELKANPDKPAKGSVVEARLDRARGPICTVLVQEGTLRVGDTVVCGEHTGKVRALLDDRGGNVEEAGPSTPVEILGMSGVPDAGDILNAVTDDKSARQVAEHRRDQRRGGQVGTASARTYEEILGQLRSGESQELKLLVKADVHGSSEAIKESLQKASTERVSVNVISAGVGGIHETDVNLAKAAGAVILGFNVRPAGKAAQLAEREGVEIRQYDVIYELIDDVRDLMRGLLPKQRTEKPIGRAEVRQTFTIPRIGTIAGCAVLDGKITRNSHLRLVREEVKIYDGRVSSLRRFKEDVREVAQGYECGIGIEGYNDIKVGDIIEAYEIEEVTPELE